MYPLIMSFPVEEGLVILEEQTANIVIVGVVSEGILTALVGKLMSWVHPDMFFYSLIMMSVAMWLICRYCFHLIRKQKEEDVQGK